MQSLYIYKSYTVMLLRSLKVYLSHFQSFTLILSLILTVDVREEKNSYALQGLCKNKIRNSLVCSLNKSKYQCFIEQLEVDLSAK